MPDWGGLIFQICPVLLDPVPKPLGSRPLMNEIKSLPRDRPRCVDLLVLRARASEAPCCVLQYILW